MPFNELELHKKLVNICCSGQISELKDLAVSQAVHVRNLVLGDVAHKYKSKYGTYRPGDYVYVASEHNYSKVVHYLLVLGGDANSVCNSITPARTPLSIACDKGYIKVVNVLHDYGVALHSDSNFKTSPIYNSVRFGNLEVLKCIVEKVPGVLTKTTGGEIGMCPKVSYTDIWANLTKIAAQDDAIVIGSLLLYVACIQKHLEIVKYLVTRGVSLHVLLPKASFFADTMNPLSAACKNEDEEMAAYLLENKVEISESIIDCYPEFIGSVLKRHTQEYRRSHSILKSSCKDHFPPDSAIAIYWDSLELHKLHRVWIEPDAATVYSMDVHDNKISSLPSDFFVFLSNMEELDLSSNRLSSLPSNGLDTIGLVKILICDNNLTNIPIEIFMNPVIHRIDLTTNNISFFPPNNEVDGDGVRWNCSSLKCLRCSKNVLSSVPDALAGAVSLEKLYLNRNRMETFEIAWRCPLMDLDLSFNQLKQFGCKSHVYWSKTLQKLNLSHNNLNSISSNICQLENLQELDVSHNNLRTLPPPRNWMTKILFKLNLSHNELYTSVRIDESIVAMGMETVNFRNASSGTCEFPDDLFENCLQILNLSHNRLEMVPSSICRLKSLSELDLGNNPSITTLPNELGRLKNIWNLRLTNLNLPDLPVQQANDKNLAKTVLPTLRARLRKSVSFNRMKLMVVGLQGSGKTTLIATLQGKKPTLNVATNGVSVENWSLSINRRRSSALPIFWNALSESHITFSSWDLAGQHVYYATHQCFLTGKTLYLAVFNSILGTEGVENLGTWLLNIQARAPDSKVIIVGTHIDGIPETKRKTVLGELEVRIFEKYNKKGFPCYCGCVFVSNIKGDNLQILRDEIVNVATQIIEDESYGGIVGAGKTAPRSYIQLYNNVIKEKLRREAEKLLPILTTDEMMDLAKSDPDNDIIDVEELLTAAAFLHENGILLHFNDHLRELNTSFFIDPPWLCELLAKVVTVKERNPYVQGGKISEKDLKTCSGLPARFIPQYLQLLERFEIVLCLDESTYLIPCMLPIDHPSILTEKQKLGSRKAHYITRNYHMAYIPAGFWSRLIARIIIAVHKWGTVPLNRNDDNGKKPECLDEYSTTFWREGIIVFYSSGCFLVEYFEDEVKHEGIHNKGVAICIWAEDYDFSTMGFIVDHLDSLISEWYPGLDDVDEFGEPVVQKLIPCPSCMMTLQQEDPMMSNHEFRFVEGFNANFRNPTKVRQFSLAVCAIAAANYIAISCHRHEEEVVPLNQVVPDLLLTDLPSHYVINQDVFEFNPCDETMLGEGGAGGVYKGTYEGHMVAVKQFHSSHKSLNEHNKKKKRNSDNIFKPSKQTFEERLEDTKVVKAFWDLRQEVAVLCRLQHPNIVKFIGFCRSPLCFVLELAPLGSLWDVLRNKVTEREKEAYGEETSKCTSSVLGRSLTHKIALQVAHAVAYLHDSKIIYRDLKSDNILVWSVEEDAVINVKLSDYGISAFATPQGVIGEGGTPGFQAPEIKQACPYDAKVDIFSYGMWLYEMMSGKRPFQIYRSAVEMKKAISRGQRPDLRNDEISPGIPYLELLMKDCWQQIPKYRPTSFEVVSRLERVDVGMLRSVFPMYDSCTLSKVRCVIPVPTITQGNSSTVEGNYVLVFCGEDTERSYKLINLQEGREDVNIPCCGPRISCAAFIGDLLWLGTEGKRIEVMTLKMSLKNSKDRKLDHGPWTIDLEDHCMDLVMYENKDLELVYIFASLANGTLVAFKHNREGDQEGSSIKDEWSHSQVIDLVTQGKPAKCLCLTRDKSELWVSSGNIVVILKPDTLEIIDRIETFPGARNLIYAMVTDHKYVWVSERRMPTVIQLDVETRTVLHKFRLKFENIISHNIVFDESDGIPVRGSSVSSRTSIRSGKVSEGSPLQSKKGVSYTDGSPLQSKKGVSFTNQVEYEQYDGDTSDSNNTLENILEPKFNQGDSLDSNALMKVSLCKRPSLSSIKSFTSSLRESCRPRSIANQIIRITSLLYYEEKLYIGRSSGDIVIVDVKADRTCELEDFGKVIGQLGGSVGYEDDIRSVSCILPFGSTHILSSVRIDPSNRSFDQSVNVHDQLLVFKVWSSSQLDQFYLSVQKTKGN